MQKQRRDRWKCLQMTQMMRTNVILAQSYANRHTKNVSEPIRARRPLFLRHGDEWRVPCLGWIGNGCFLHLLCYDVSMKQKRAFKCRIYPTPDKQHMIDNTYGCCRFVYNWVLRKQTDA